jgi:hypothetical protein
MRPLQTVLPLVLIFTINHSLFAQTSASQNSTIQLIQTLFNNGSYLSAEIEARRLLEKSSLSDSVKLQAEKFIAFSLIAQDKDDDAVHHFIAALEIDSTFSLDPFLTSPKILSVFRESKDRFILLQQNKQQAASLSSQSHSPGTVSFRAILFPGWEQVYQKRSEKGYILICAGIVSLGSTVSLDLERIQARNSYLSASTSAAATSRYNRYNNFRKAEIYFAALSGIIYTYSLVDAFQPLPPLLEESYVPNRTGVSFSLRFPL